jgi:hypothetical protein
MLKLVVSKLAAIGHYKALRKLRMHADERRRKGMEEEWKEVNF